MHCRPAKLYKTNPTSHFQGLNCSTGTFAPWVPGNLALLEPVTLTLESWKPGTLAFLQLGHLETWQPSTLIPQHPDHDILAPWHPNNLAPLHRSPWHPCNLAPFTLATWGPGTLRPWLPVPCVGCILPQYYTEPTEVLGPCC